MTRGNAEYTKVTFKASSGESFVVLVDSVGTYEKWKKNESTPLAEVLSGWKIFVVHKQGSQGIMNAASKAALENEFGTSDDEECVRKILRQGQAQTKTNPERQGITNYADGPTNY